MVGAILTQNTSWANVEKTIAILRRAGALNPHTMRELPAHTLAGLIRPAGYYNVKASRLREFLRYYCGSYGADHRRMARRTSGDLRAELLRVKGIGKETADSMLLYALQKPVFVVDAYTKRVFARHGLIADDASYEEVQALCMSSIQPDVLVYNEYHALLVRLAKEYCRKSAPRCRGCPLEEKA
jgi:endonuclease-3 related protein